MAKKIKRYVIFTSLNAGGHSLTFFKTPQEVIDSIQGLSDDDTKLELTDSEIESIKNLEVGNDIWVSYFNSTWKTIFCTEIEL